MQNILCILLGVCNSRLLCVLQPSIFVSLHSAVDVCDFRPFGLCSCILWKKNGETNQKKPCKNLWKEGCREKRRCCLGDCVDGFWCVYSRICSVCTLCCREKLVFVGFQYFLRIGILSRDRVQRTSPGSLWFAGCTLLFLLSCHKPFSSYHSKRQSFLLVSLLHVGVETQTNEWKIFLQKFSQYGQTMFSHLFRKECGSNFRSTKSFQSFSAEATISLYIFENSSLSPSGILLHLS